MTNNDQVASVRPPEAELPDRRTSTVAVGFALATTLLIAWMCWRNTDRTLIYALDDPYIHLAMAETLAEHLMLGVNQHTPCAASSSPLWTTILAVLVIVGGVSHSYPFILNLIAVAVLAFLCDLVLRVQFGLPSSTRVVTVVAVMLIGPIAPLAMTGMEHIAHAAVVLLLMYRSIGSAAASGLSLASLAGIAVGLRYESMFVVGALAVIMALHGRPKAALMVAAGASAVVVIVGFVQMQAGHHFFANSLLVKALPVDNLADMAKWRIQKAIGGAQQGPLAVLVIGSAVLALSLHRRRGCEHQAYEPSNQALQWVFVLAASTALHWTLASVGWFARYEAYLIIMGIVIMAGLLNLQLSGISASDRAPMWHCTGSGVWVLVLVASLTVFGLAAGSRVLLYTRTHHACRNIHEQQHQMARFVQTFHDDDTIVINDIGMVALMSNARIVDVLGLASTEFADAIRNHRRDSEFVAEAARRANATIAILYEASYIPDTWPLIATWRIQRNVVCAADTVGFYAVDARHAPTLRQQLVEFEDRLPSRVEVSYHTAAPAGP